MYYIGIDLGTSSLKSILMDDDKKIIKSVSKDYPIYYPKEGYSEQDPHDRWQASLSSIKELTQDIDKTQVKSLSIGGQMHGLVALDEKGSVIRKAILWNDTRTKKETNYFNEEIGRDILSKNTGNIAYAGFTLPKILWMEENEPENYKKIRHILLPKDYIIYKLTGEFATDFSDASGTLLLDVENKKRSDQMCKYGHVDPARLPKLYESYEIVGNLKEDIRKELGFSENCNLVAGGGDNALAAISVSAIGENSCNISLGTSGTIFIPTDKFVKEENYGLHSFAHASGKYHLMGCTLSAASSLNRWMTDILKTEEFDKEQENIENLGTNRVFFMPYLNGERSPHNDEDIRGGFLGLSSSTSRKDMTLAVLEGVAYSLRDCLECAKDLGIYPKKSTVVGGGAKSDLWCKILANVLNLPIYRMKGENGPGLGAAFLAKYANQEEKSLEEITKIDPSMLEVFQPEKDLTEKYEKGYEKYKKLYPILKDFYKD
jgi:xylulokinase